MRAPEIYSSGKFAVCKYAHLQACEAGGFADADGGFARGLLDHCIRESGTFPRNFLSLPQAWVKEPWKKGEVHTSGGESFLVLFILDQGKEGYTPEIEPEEGEEAMAEWLEKFYDKHA